jgi:hypothetical protein
MKTWIEISGDPLPHRIESHLEPCDTVAVVVKGLTRAEADHIEACLVRDEEMVVCTDYDNGYCVIVEPILNASVVAREATGDVYTLLIRDVTMRPPLPPHRPLWDGDGRHGSGIGRD